MVCEDCGNNEATCLYTEIQSLEHTNKKTVHHLCRECAEKRSGGETLTTTSLDIGHFLAELAEQNPDESVEPEGAACPSCGFVYGQLGKEGRLGCNACYDVFETEIDTLLKRIHGSILHTGKVPRRSGGSSTRELPPAKERPRISDLNAQISELEKELGIAVSDENFERAAQLRDRIATLREGQGSQRGGRGHGG